MAMIVQNYVGCDISKDRLDFFTTSAGYQRVATRPRDRAYVAGLAPSQLRHHGGEGCS